MDATASACSFFHNLGYSSCAISGSAYYNKCSSKSQERLQYLLSLTHSISLRSIDTLHPIIRNSRRFIACNSSSTNPDRNPTPEIAVLLEVDGVLIDAYFSGNRQAFNVAFRKLGLDCANWTEPIYSDLFRKGVGDEERMLDLFFNRIGWPTSLPTTEKETFKKSVLREKKKAMDDFILSKDCSLRPGVERFIDDALNHGIPVAILAASSVRGEEVARSTIEKLGIERISKLKIIGNEEIKESMYSQLVCGQATFSGLDEELAKEANKAVAAEKKKIAKEVASVLKLHVDINSGTAESLQEVIAALRAAAECTEVPLHKCVLVAGSISVVGAAERIGMPCIVVRNRLTYGAEFPSAKAVYDGFGDVDLTMPKLRRKLVS